MNEELKGNISEASAGLIYISETDAAIEPFEGGAADAVTADNLLGQVGAAADSQVEERGFEEIFERLIRLNGARFGVLKTELEQNLRDVKVFKVGRINVDIYIVGLDADGNLSGVQTKAVET